MTDYSDDIDIEEFKEIPTYKMTIEREVYWLKNNKNSVHNSW